MDNLLNLWDDGPKKLIYSKKEPGIIPTFITLAIMAGTLVFIYIKTLH